jgi:GH24 family phage-related lysozyme (muramidase)
MASNAQKRKATALAIATALAVPMEGIRQVAYYDPAGILTVCDGSTTGVEKGKIYSLAECRQRLNDDMLAAINTVDRCVPGLPPHMLAAWGDAVYNLGPAIVCNKTRSTAARLLTSGQRLAACDQLPRWDKARIAGVQISLPGLTKRRLKEQSLCKTGELT